MRDLMKELVASGAAVQYAAYNDMIVSHIQCSSVYRDIL